MSAVRTDSEAFSDLQKEDDWDGLKADIKDIVKILRSLAPPQAASPRGAFLCSEDTLNNWLPTFPPTPERLAMFEDVLLSMLTRKDDGNFVLWNTELVCGKWFPTGTHTQTIQSQGVILGGTRSTQPPQFEKLIRERRANVQIRDREDWVWGFRTSPDESFTLYHIGGSSKEVEYKVFDTGGVERLWEGRMDTVERVSTRGYGTLCFIRAPVRGDTLDLRCVNLIMAQISRWHYMQKRWGPVVNDRRHFDSALFFLSVFAGLWPSRNDRLEFSRQFSMSSRRTFDRFYLQVHFRYFTSAKQLEKTDTPSIHCFREQGQIVSTTLGVSLHTFRESRISVFGLLSTQDNMSLPRAAPFYSVLALGETEFGSPDGYDLKWCAGLEGTIAFQIAVLASVDTWTKEWNNVLDQIDECVHFQFNHTLDHEKINRWMFDDDFERSRLYFTILQVLRIFSGCISTVSDDLRPLDDVFLKRTDFPMQEMRQDELRILRSNWESVKKTQDEAEKILLSRILSKTEEVKSLRDGLFNASSLREANKSSTTGRYVLIFTVVTVLFLPPSFISTVFALDIFQKNIAQTKWEYKVALVSVSLVTYAVSFAAVIAVDGEKLKRRFLQRWNDFKKGPLNEARPAPGMQDEESGAPKKKR